MRSFLLFMLAAWFAGSAEQHKAPSDFGHSDLGDKATSISAAWNDWSNAAKNLEDDIGRLPAEQGKHRIREALASCLAYIEAYRTYTDNVASKIELERDRLGVDPEIVSGDELNALGMSLAILQKRLDVLRETPGWLTARRATQTDRSSLMKLEDMRRDQIDFALPSSKNTAKRAISASGFRASEKEMLGALEKMWTDYYVALADATYHSAAGIAGLNAKPGVSANPRRDRAPNSELVPGSTRASEIAGSWVYREGSKQFEGFAEPRKVILELAEEGGELTGRYRAALTDFDGVRYVDLNLRGKLISGRQKTVEFSSPGPEGAGKLILIRPKGNGMQLLVVRSPEPGSVVPRGRELLTRR